MRVKKLVLNDFRAVRQMEIEFSPNVNVLVGANGAGKSTILEALAILLSWLIARIKSSDGKGRSLSLNDIRIGSKETYNRLYLDFENKEYLWILSKGKPGRRRQTISRFDGVKKLSDIIKDRLEEQQDVNLPLAVFYSVNRLVIDVPSRGRKINLTDQLAAYTETFTEKRNDFKLFFNWFRYREDLENEKARYRTALIEPDNSEFPDRQLKAVRAAIESLMPGYTDLKVKRAPLRMVLNKNGKEIRVDQLSDGEKCLISMVGDIARRLALANPALKNSLEGEGVILIDEVDLHLHPAWQRSVVTRLTETFPNCQFIVSTHSPQIIGEIKPGNVIFLRDDKETDGIIHWQEEQTYGLTANQILEETMDASSINTNVQESINQVFSSIEKEKYTLAREQINELKKNLHGSVPDLQEAEAMIAMMEIDTSEEDD